MNNKKEKRTRKDKKKAKNTREPVPTPELIPETPEREEKGIVKKITQLATSKFGEEKKAQYLFRTTKQKPDVPESVFKGVDRDVAQLLWNMKFVPTNHKQCVGEGLDNYGNTCYLNALLQVIASGTYEISRIPSNVPCPLKLFFVMCYQLRMGAVDKRVLWELVNNLSQLHDCYKIKGQQQDTVELWHNIIGSVPNITLFDPRWYECDSVSSETLRNDFVTPNTNRLAKIFDQFKIIYSIINTCNLCNQKSIYATVRHNTVVKLPDVQLIEYPIEFYPFIEDEIFEMKMRFKSNYTLINVVVKFLDKLPNEISSVIDLREVMIGIYGETTTLLKYDLFHKRAVRSFKDVTKILIIMGGQLNIHRSIFPGHKHEWKLVYIKLLHSKGARTRTILVTPSCTNKQLCDIVFCKYYNYFAKHMGVMTLTHSSTFDYSNARNNDFIDNAIKEMLIPMINDTPISCDDTLLESSTYYISNKSGTPFSKSIKTLSRMLCDLSAELPVDWFFKKIEQYPESLVLPEKCTHCDAQDIKGEVNKICLPVNWLIHIDRLRYSKKFNKVIKSQTHVNIGSTCIVYGQEFELHAVLCHTGDTSTEGHYYSYINIEGKWLLYDDNIVKESDWTDIPRDKIVLVLYKQIMAT